VIKKKPSFGLLLVIILSLIWICWLAWFIVPSAIIAWDEAGYLLSSFGIYKVLKTGDLVSFCRNTRSQFYYPFFQSWLLGGLSLVFGFSPLKARIIGLTSLLFSGIIVFKLANMLEKKPNKIVGSLASLIFLTSPATLFFHSIAMRERMGLLLTLMAIYFYFKALEKKRFPLFILTDFILISLFSISITTWSWRFLP